MFVDIGLKSIPFIKRNHETKIVMNRHLQIYHEILSNGEPNIDLYAEMRK